MENTVNDQQVAGEKSAQRPVQKFYKESQKHEKLTRIKAYLEATLGCLQLNQHLARQGIIVMVDPALVPEGLMSLPAPVAPIQTPGNVMSEAEPQVTSESASTDETVSS